MKLNYIQVLSLFVLVAKYLDLIHWNWIGVITLIVIAVIFDSEPTEN